MPKLTGSILVVDDNRMNRLMLARGLEQQGHQVLFAEHGRQALEMLHNHAPDVVLLDIEMPEMNGFQATREIRKQKRFVKLPIIAVTAKATKNDQVLCMEAGTNDYLAKPIDLHQLFSVIRVWMPN